MNILIRTFRPLLPSRLHCIPVPTSRIPVLFIHVCSEHAHVPQIANINLISKPETYGGDLLRKVLRGLLFMLSGKGTSQEPLRRESQRLAARALSWLCWVAEVPGILLEKPADGAVGFRSGMRTIAQCLHESNDRAVSPGRRLSMHHRVTCDVCATWCE
jgi:hypothetical protein